MTSRTYLVAQKWHELSDHAADGTPFGGPLCNCYTIAPRIEALMATAWDQGASADVCRCSAWSEGECACGNYPSEPNPYREPYRMTHRGVGA